mmetsp:Transcript_31396/g.96990  ORF Transcript_31396/g.96990 Transcript_31396/m.96990 type:complete len:491 (-) Transcript_31396:840-2312(-)
MRIQSACHDESSGGGRLVVLLGASVNGRRAGHHSLHDVREHAAPWLGDGRELLAPDDDGGGGEARAEEVVVMLHLDRPAPGAVRLGERRDVGERGEGRGGDARVELGLEQRRERVGLEAGEEAALHRRVLREQNGEEVVAHVAALPLLPERLPALAHEREALLVAVHAVFRTRCRVVAPSLADGLGGGLVCGGRVALLGLHRGHRNRHLLLRRRHRVARGARGELVDEAREDRLPLVAHRGERFPNRDAERGERRGQCVVQVLQLHEPRLAVLGAEGVEVRERLRAVEQVGYEVDDGRGDVLQIDVLQHAVAQAAVLRQEHGVEAEHELLLVADAGPRVARDVEGGAAGKRRHRLFAINDAARGRADARADELRRRVGATRRGGAACAEAQQVAHIGQLDAPVLVSEREGVGADGVLQRRKRGAEQVVEVSRLHLAPGAVLRAEGDDSVVAKGAVESRRERVRHGKGDHVVVGAREHALLQRRVLRPQHL